MMCLILLHSIFCVLLHNISTRKRQENREGSVESLKISENPPENEKNPVKFTCSWTLSG